MVLKRSPLYSLSPPDSSARNNRSQPKAGPREPVTFAACHADTWRATPEIDTFSQSEADTDHDIDALYTRYTGTLDTTSLLRSV